MDGDRSRGVAPSVRRFAGDGHAIGQISRSLRWNVQCAQADVEQSCGIALCREKTTLDTRGKGDIYSGLLYLGYEGLERRRCKRR